MLKKLERNIYIILVILLLGTTFYYAYQYTRYEVNWVHLTTEPFAVPQTSREWKADPPISPSAEPWVGYNTVTYVEPELPDHKEKQGQLVYYDSATRKLYTAAMSNRTLREIYQVEEGWVIQDYDLTGHGWVLVAVGKTVHDLQGVTNWGKGFLIDTTKPKPVIRAVFDKEGGWSESNWYDLKAFQFSPDGRYIFHHYSGYGSEEVTVYDTATLQTTDLAVSPEREQELGFGFAGFVGSNIFLATVEESFYLYQYDLERKKYDYGSYYHFLPINMWSDQERFYAFGRTLEAEERYYLTQMPYLPEKSRFTALGEKGEKVRTYLPNVTKVAEVPNQPSKDQKVITVANVHELADAIGSNRTILLKPGIYNLSAIRMDESKYVMIDDDEGMIIHDVQNLSILAATPLYAELIVDSSFANVLNLRDCNRVTIQGFLMGHHPQYSDSQGTVLGLAHCTEVQIRDCIMFTSGMDGLKIAQTERVSLDNAAITDSSLYAAEVIESKHITFRGVRFLENRGGIAVKYSANVALIDCEIAKNHCNGLFELVESEDILVQRSRIRGNQGSYLADTAADLELRECLMEGNAFTVPYIEATKQRKVE